MPESFSASAAMLGYLYQSRRALLLALEELRNSRLFVLRFETLDDVVFESEGAPHEIIQTKHHTNKAAHLTDGAPELWKTLRIWASHFLDGSLPDDAALALLTTATASQETAPFLLRPGQDRDVDRAHSKLLAVVESSTSAVNKLAYAAFRDLGRGRQLELLSRVTVYDSQPDITDLDAELQKAVFFAAEPKHQQDFLVRLDGWWLKQVLSNLIDADAAPILGEELHAELSRLREQFKEENLPVDDDIMDAEIPASGFEDKTFVTQLHFIELGNPRILLAIKDYFRAFEQRSRWIRQDLVLVGELHRYEERLIEEWKFFFEQMREDLGEDAADEVILQAAKTLYKWVESGEHIRIRANVAHPSIARGSLHMLADAPRIGWHMHWRKRLQKILERPVEAEA